MFPHELRTSGNHPSYVVVNFLTLLCDRLDLHNHPDVRKALIYRRKTECQRQTQPHSLFPHCNIVLRYQSVDIFLGAQSKPPTKIFFMETHIWEVTGRLKIKVQLTLSTSLEMVTITIFRTRYLVKLKL